MQRQVDAFDGVEVGYGASSVDQRGVLVMVVMVFVVVVVVVVVAAAESVEAVAASCIRCAQMAELGDFFSLELELGCLDLKGTSRTIRQYIESYQL